MFHKGVLCLVQTFNLISVTCGMAESVVTFRGCAARFVLIGPAARDRRVFERQLRRLGFTSFFGRRIALDTGEVSYDVLVAVSDPTGYGEKAGATGLLGLMLLVEAAADVVLVAVSTPGEEHEFVVGHVNQLCGLDSVKDCFRELDRQLGLTCRGRLSTSGGVEYGRASCYSDGSSIGELERLFRGVRMNLDGMVESLGADKVDERIKAAKKIREEQVILKEEQVRLSAAAMVAQAERLRLAELCLIESVRKDMLRESEEAV